MANVVRAAPVRATRTGDTASMVAESEEHARGAARQGATSCTLGSHHARGAGRSIERLVPRCPRETRFLCSGAPILPGPTRAAAP